MRSDALADSLARAGDVRAASAAAVTHLEGVQLRPSVYLERGGRLRCQALHGYRQLLDGLPPWAGVIGRTYATGEAIVVPDVRDDPHYLQVTDGILAEACFPISFRGRTVGAVNVEASRPLTADDVARIDATARALGDRIEELGGPAPESASQRLVRHAIVLATQFDAAGIERAVLAAAVDITPLTSAMLLCRPTTTAPFAPCRAHGPLGRVLTLAPADAVDEVAALVASGCSAYTVSAPEAAGENAGVAVLRELGATSLAVLPAGPDRILVVAGGTSVGLSTEHCELLELLAAQASACLRTAASVSALRAQAATDALTGLGHHATFHAELVEARESGDIGVLVVDIDAFKAYNDTHGHLEGDRVLRLAAEAMSAALRRGDALYRIGGDEFAALLPGVDGPTALDVARRLHEAVGAAAIDLTVSVGAAAAAPEEPEVSVLARADRALYEVKARGRDGVALDEPTMSHRVEAG